MENRLVVPLYQRLRVKTNTIRLAKYRPAPCPIVPLDAAAQEKTQVEEAREYYECDTS
jgi:hypothetical protein